MIAQGKNTNEASIGASNFNHMLNLNILKNHDISEIAYYTLTIETIENPKQEINLTPSENIKYSSYDYVIDKYNVDIKVNENNTFDITETINTYYNV